MPAPAEKADRNKPLNVEADSGRYDDLKQVGTFTGNVVVTKGTLTMRAARIEVRQSARRLPATAVATALPGQLASFSQKRDGVDETIQGEAERIEYDGKTDTVSFVNRAVIRRYRGATLADETAGSLITYDNTREVFSVVGGTSAATPANPGGRVRATLTPREGRTAHRRRLQRRAFDTAPERFARRAPPARRASLTGRRVSGPPAASRPMA